MKNDQQREIHRFLTYVGLMLIAAAFLLPWLFIYQQNSVIISQDDFDNLTQASQRLSGRIIDLNLFIIDSLPYLSGFLFAFGLFLVIRGYRRWKKSTDSM